jgi:hypothetical protein
MGITHFAVKTRMLVNRDRTEKEPRQKIFNHYNVRIGLIKGLILHVMSEKKDPMARLVLKRAFHQISADFRYHSHLLSSSIYAYPVNTGSSDSAGLECVCAPS